MDLGSVPHLVRLDSFRRDLDKKDKTLYMYLFVLLSNRLLSLVSRDEKRTKRTFCFDRFLYILKMSLNFYLMNLDCGNTRLQQKCQENDLDHASNPSVLGIQNCCTTSSCEVKSFACSLCGKKSTTS